MQELGSCIGGRLLGMHPVPFVLWWEPILAMQSAYPCMPMYSLVHGCIAVWRCLQKLTSQCDTTSCRVIQHLLQIMDAVPDCTRPLASLATPHASKAVSL